MKRFYVQVSAHRFSLPDLLLWSEEGALRELVYQYRFPEAWNEEERAAELSRLQATAEALSGEMPKDFMFELRNDLKVLEDERRAQEAVQAAAKKSGERKSQNFRADFGNLCVGERVGSFSPRPQDRIDGLW